MPSDDLRRERENQIAVGALGLFRDKGYHATSIREIAAASGLSMGGLYEYIDAKQDVLSLVYRHLIEGVDREALTRSADLTEILIALMQGTAEHAAEVQLIYRETAALDPTHRAQLARSEQEQVAAIQAVIERGVAAGDLDVADPELAAHVVVFLTAFYPLRRWLLRHRPDLNPDALAGGVAELILGGMRPT
ncbi:MAG: TetR/AcrR family transcriptional regulator [Acidimicrobiia bacterium]|nr:TetR/AcrR family transcriptional regulator [Acidimicrobiia bacterium]